MFSVALLGATLASSLSPLGSVDTLQYVVLNHGRAAGEMRVISDGDSALVRYVYQDRQRGRG